MEVVKVAGSSRTNLGKKACKAARKEGDIPGVMYGGGEVLHFSTTKAELKSVVYTGNFKIIELNVDGKSYKCILKDIQFHPITDSIVHVDFLRLFDGVKINVEVPVKFRGSSTGVVEGGKLIQNVRKIKLKTVPESLVDHVMLSIEGLELGSSVRVRDIDPMDGVQVMNEPSTPVAIVEVPRALKSAESEEEAEEADGGGDDKEVVAPAE